MSIAYNYPLPKIYQVLHVRQNPQPSAGKNCWWLANKATAPFTAVDIMGNYRAVHQAWRSRTWGKPLVDVKSF